MISPDLPYDPITGEIIETPAEGSPLAPLAAKPNVAEYSVSEISQKLKRTLEESFGHIRVRGEISGYRGPHSSGHAYFAIKDEGAKLDAVIWRGVFSKLGSKLQEGLEVIATGKITSYPGKSSYQIVIEKIEPAGAGALMALLDERRRKLAAEGLFDQAHKRPLPYIPKLIGVITSPTGAVIRDILHRLAERFPRPVLVWPVRVQGETSAAEVTAAIKGMQALPNPPDLIIVARGGGSLEDLWGFNDEALVRAVAASTIPIISAVGHETDTTLIDLVADLRAPTPTAAAERAVPVRADLLAELASLSARQQRGLARYRDEQKMRLRAAARALPQPDELLALSRQRLDSTAQRLPQALRTNLQHHRLDLSRASGQLSLPRLIQFQAERQSRLAELTRRQHRAATQHLAQLTTQLKLSSQRLNPALTRAWRESQTSFNQQAARLQPQPLLRQKDLLANRLSEITQRMARAAQLGLAQKSDKLSAQAKLLAAMSYKSVLARGFALVQDSKGRPVTLAQETQPGQLVKLTFADDSVSAQVRKNSTQGELF